MPIVSLTLSRTEAGSAVADLLSGGSSGCDIGTVANGSSSTAQEIYVRHNGTQNITSVAYYIQAYTGVYGGDFSANADYAKLLALGDGAGTYGLLFDEDWNSSPNFTTKFKIKTGTADSFANKRSIQISALSYWNGSTKVDPTGGVIGILAPNDNSAGAQLYGNRLLLRYRIDLPLSEVDGGIRQFDIVTAYTYTS